MTPGLPGWLTVACSGTDSSRRPAGPGNLVFDQRHDLPTVVAPGHGLPGGNAQGLASGWVSQELDTSAGERRRAIPEEDLDAIAELQSLRTNRGRYDGLAVGRGLHNLDPCSAPGKDGAAHDTRPPVESVEVLHEACEFDARRRTREARNPLRLI